MIRIKLYKNRILKGIGQIGMCENAGSSMDILLKHGFEVRLDNFDPGIDPIPERQHQAFLKEIDKVTWRITGEWTGD